MALILLDVGGMKQLVHLMGVAFVCGVLNSAFAGTEAYSGKEMKQVAPAPLPECDFSWTGFYLGGNAGYGWGHADTDFSPRPDAATFFDLVPQTLEADPDGFIGGGQIGFNWQMNKWFVLGIESDFQGTDMEGDETRGPLVDITGAPLNPDSFIAAHERVQWLGTTRGRIGISPACRWLFYVTGGVAYGNVDYSATTNYGAPSSLFSTYPTSFTETKVGWTAGGGIEYALNNHWSVRAEYLHYDLGDEDSTAHQLTGGVPQGPPFAVHYNFDTAGEIVRGGINFKF
ncbi:MAG TPA: outer membrane protein [Chthoniobacterales bacterium]|nr:outer membrane protein [Chthoniobacterales bacterium]